MSITTDDSSAQVEFFSSAQVATQDMWNLLCLTHLTGGTNKAVMSSKLAGKKPSLRSLVRLLAR